MASGSSTGQRALKNVTSAMSRRLGGNLVRFTTSRRNSTSTNRETGEVTSRNRGTRTTTRSKAGSSGSSTNTRRIRTLANTKTQYTMKQLNGMNRSQLVKLALATAVKNASKKGISQEEAYKRASMLMSGNTTAQLRKYINKNGKI